MSVVQDFKCKNVKVSSEHKQVYLLHEYGSKDTFRYDIRCSTPIVSSFDDKQLHFFFDFSSNKCLIVVPVFANEARCAIMRFWLEEDRLKLSANWLLGQESYVAIISDDFRDKHAGLILDGIINS